MDLLTAEWTVAGRRLTAVGGTVTGNHYNDNYDKLHVDDARALAVVADGMGDGPGSALAGRTAVDVFLRYAAAARDSGVRDAGALRAAVAEVQRAVIAAGHGQPYLTGCTLTAFVANSAESAQSADPAGATDPAGAAGAWLVQLGDSRVYRLRDGLLELLTVDHTMAWLGVVHGWYPADSPQAATARYQLTRYAGHPEAPEPDLLDISLRPGDALLLCTDGVSDQLSYERLAELVSEGSVETLLDDTLVTGADNATAVLIRVE